jgi:membrane protease YdiL (CAAX protease family)
MTTLGIRPRPEQPAVMVYVTMIAMAPINGFAGVILGAGPLGEEPGWRGYALPRLLARMGDVKQSVLMGTLWAAWHLPVMIALPEWRGGVGLAGFIPLYWIGVIAAAYTVTKIWRWSRGSVFLAIWFHGVVNYIGSYAYAREIWTVDAYSDLQRAALQTLTFVLTALIVALISRSEFARRHHPLAIQLEP